MFTVPELPYAYNALEPHIDQQTMQLHHDKHHQAYVDKLNAALQPYPEIAQKNITEILRSFDTLPEEVKTAVRNHGGGHANHSLFWTVMAPHTGEAMQEDFSQTITSVFGDLQNFKGKFAQAATGVFGSGWTWLVSDKGTLSITTTPNQDSPLVQGQLPLLGLDVWEHAYYLKYQNRRPEYIDAWWNVVNWNEVATRFNTAKNT